jgi:hypothetical protein
MYVRNILMGIGPNETLLIRDHGYHVLVSRIPGERFQYQIVHNFPAFGSPELIHNWLLHHNVQNVIDLHGAIYFMEGFNTALQ